MSTKPIHFLHLNEHCLRWMTIEGGAQKPKLRDQGVLAGESRRCLDDWAASRELEDAEVRLYDGRPMYFSFKFSLPAKAKKQSADIIKLKIKQELGLSANAVRWAVRNEAEQDARDQMDMFTVVVRREALDDIDDWAKRHGIDDLWVGADVSAIRTLTRRGLLPSPVLIVNSDSGGSTLYQAGERDQVAKQRWDEHHGSNGTSLPLIEVNESSMRAEFGANGRSPILTAHPELAALTEAPEIDFQHNGRGLHALESLGREAVNFDAVMLGGLVERGLRGEAMESLLREEAAKRKVAIPLLDLNFITVGAIALFTALIMGVSVWSSIAKREEARVQLVERASELNEAIERYRSQESVLERIKTDKTDMVPIIEAVHEAAPEGTLIQSLNFLESGRVEISGTVPSQESATRFSNALMKIEDKDHPLWRDGIFEDVKLSGVKANVQRDGGNSNGGPGFSGGRGGGGRGPTFQFQLTAAVKGRGKKR